MALTKEQFSQLIPEYQNALHKHIRSKVSNVHEAEDLLQETIIDAYKDIESLQDADKLLSWMKTIALHRISKHFKQKKKVLWTEMADQIQGKTEEDKKHLFKEFDDMFQLLAESGVQEVDLLTAGLYFCLNWPAGQIASIQGKNRSTVYGRIRKAKLKVESKKRGRGTVTPDQSRKLKIALSGFLANAGSGPPNGQSLRNSYFHREAYFLAHLTWLQYPDDPEATYNVFRIAMVNIIVSQYPNDMSPVLFYVEWQSDRLDKKLLAQFEQYHQKLQSMDISPKQRCLVDYFYHLVSPKRNEDVDWKQLLELCKKIIIIDSNTPFYLEASKCIEILDGPLEAAEYLEAHKNSRLLQHMVNTHCRIADLYVLGKSFRKAITHFRKALKWPMTEERTKIVKYMINRCKGYLKEEVKKG